MVISTESIDSCVGIQRIVDDDCDVVHPNPNLSYIHASKRSQ